MKFELKKNGDYKLTDAHGFKAGRISGGYWKPSKSRICMSPRELREIADFIDNETKIKND